MNSGHVDILGALRSENALRDGVSDKPEHRVDSVQHQTQPARPPAMAGTLLERRLHPRIVANLKAAGIESLYRHQRDAIELALSGTDMILECPTASGKTLCFDIPVIQRLAESKDGHALMMFPMKALARDQVRQFNQLVEGVTHYSRAKKIEVWTYDGDTDTDSRRVLRGAPPSVLMTNPEMLHTTFLGHRDKWETFLKNLKVLVVDEIHEYRGFFGTQVSMLLRRFLAFLESIGVHPQVILATATCANPEEHARRLTGRECKLVRADDAWAPRRDFFFIQPSSIPDHDFAGIFKHRIASAALAMEKSGLSTIVFCPSRDFVEDVTRRCHGLADKAGRGRGPISPYRAGYATEDRESIESGLRDGSIKVVFTTSALEIGIDVGKLDVCILAGFPDSTMSAWQRIGRVGRAVGRTAHVIYFAMNNAFDQFYAQNLSAFLQRHLDEIFIGTDNEELMKQHLPYLLAEVGWKRGDAVNGALGDSLVKFTDTQTKGAKPAANAKPYYQRLQIRGSSGAILKLIVGGKEIGDISEEQAFREAYQGAIYPHQGSVYKVLAKGGGEVQLEPADPKLKTKPGFYTTMTPRETLRGLRYGSGISQSYGKVDFYRNFTGYELINDHTGDLIERVQANDTRRLTVRSLWFEFEHQGQMADLSAVDLLAVQQLLRIGSMFAVPCDRHDIDMQVDPPSRRVYFHESVEGGIGIADRAYDVWRSILTHGMEIARSCSCEDGCPRCVHPPRYRPTEGLISKTRGLEVGRRLIELTEAEPIEEFDPSINGWRFRTAR